MAAIASPQPQPLSQLVCHQDLGIFADKLPTIEKALSNPLHNSERTRLGKYEVLDRTGDPVFTDLGAFKRINYCVERDLILGEFTVYLALSSPVNCPQFAKEKMIFELLSDVPDVAKPLLIQTKGNREYMVSELFNQGDLFSLIDNKMKLRKFCTQELKFKDIEVDKFSLDLACYSLVATLIECHARGVIHRDVKPENILVRQIKNGGLEFKLIDFGAALLAEEETKEEACKLCGTDKYLSTAQWNTLRKTGKLLPADYSRDKFALGFTFFAMKAGGLPGRNVLSKTGQFQFQYFRNEHLDLGIFADEIKSLALAGSKQLPTLNTIQGRMAAILSRTYPSLQQLKALKPNPLLPPKPAYVWEEDFVRATTRERRILGEDFASRKKEYAACLQTPDCVSAEEFFSTTPRKRRIQGESFSIRNERYTAFFQTLNVN